MPCKTCGKDCKCMRMMSKRGCGTRSCDADCPCSCNTRTSSRATAQTLGPDGQQQGGGQTDGSQQTECGQSGGGCGCAGGGDGTIVGCGDSCAC